MPMARALRRTLSPQILERNNCMSSATVLQTAGGGSVVFAVEKPYEHAHTQHNHVACLTSLGSGGMAGPAGFSPASSLATLAPHSDSVFSLSNLSFLFPVPWLRLMGRTGGSMERPPKTRGMFLKRPMLHLLLCLVLGMVLGFTSICWSDFSSSGRDDPRRDLALVNDFVTNLQREGSRTVNRGETLVKFASLSTNTGVGQIDETNPGIEGPDISRDLQIGQIEPNSVDLAPSLNYTLDPERKLLIVVTPTYNRAFQAHYLNRLAHTLRLVPPPILWLVVEMPYQTLETAAILRQTGIMYRHLVCRNNLTAIKDTGVHQRNFALEHIEMHQLNGIVYFADDNNVYSQELFEQMRKIRRFGTWLVGMLADRKAKAMIEGPVCDGEKVIGWHTSEKNKRVRRFHVDMSGFAFNSTFLWDIKVWRHRSAKPIRLLEGSQETTFIEQLVEDEEQMEGLPSGCNKIMVWHLHMEAPDLIYPYGWSLPKPMFPNIALQTQV